MKTLAEIILAKGVRTAKGCLEWPNARNGQGYGMMWFKKKVRPVHRVIMFLLDKAPLSSSVVKVLHECDNPCCFEPAHLKAGSQSRNIKDAHIRGRRTRYLKTPRDIRGRFSKGSI